MLTFPCLAVVTDRTLLSPMWTLAQAIAPAVTGGANLVILLETDLPAAPRLAVARFLAEGVHGRVPWIASGKPEFALDAGADGVLLEDESATPADAREVLGPAALVGIAASRTDTAAGAGAADFVLLSLDWFNPAVALSTLEAYKSLSAGPLLAGIDPPLDQIHSIMAAGAAGITICAPAMQAENRAAVVRDYAEAIGV